MRAAQPQDGLHRWISGPRCRSQAQRTTFVPRAREDPMARAGWERCSLKITRRPDPVSPDEVGMERTEDTAVAVNLTTPVELVVLSVKQKAARCRLRESGQAGTGGGTRLWDLGPGVIAGVPARKQCVC